MIILPNRAVLRLTGEDRVSFLQGLVSNDVTKAGENTAVWAAFLTPQGKYLHDFFILVHGESLLLDCEADRIEDLKTRLSRFRLRAKVELEVVEDLSVAAVLNGEAGYADPRLTEMGRRLIVPKAESGGPMEDYDTRRLNLGLPDSSRDITPEKDVLLEVGFEDLHGVDFKKGCYMGQEVTARTKYRGLVKKRLMPVSIDGPCPAPGTPLIWEGREAGEMRSSLGRQGLAMVRLAFFEAGRIFEAGESKVTPRQPDWMTITES